MGLDEMDLKSLTRGEAWELYRPTAADLDDYADRNAAYLTKSDAVCVMNWNTCTEAACMLYGAGCPHITA